jgi:hypothetical protein
MEEKTFAQKLAHDIISVETDARFNGTLEDLLYLDEPTGWKVSFDIEQICLERSTREHPGDYTSVGSIELEGPSGTVYEFRLLPDNDLELLD